MADLLQEKKAKRFQFLKALYDSSDGGHPTKFVDMNKLGKDLGFAPTETESIAFFLKGEGLMEFKTLGGWVGLTHYGIQQVEAALSAPDEATTYFPPVVNIVHVGAMHGSQILQAGAQSTQVTTPATLDGASLLALVTELRTVLAHTPPPAPADVDDLERHLGTIETQARSPRGNRVIVRETLSTIRTILEGAAGNVAAAGILDQIGSLVS